MKQFFKHHLFPRLRMTKRASRTALGFTLIETVIYITILAVFSVIAVNAIIVILASFKNVRAERAVNTAAYISLERIVRDTRAASNVAQAQSIFDANPGRLTLTNSDASTREFYMENGELKIKEDDVYTGTLIANTVVVDTLIFRFINHGQVQGVRIEMALHDTRTPGVVKQFSDTAVLRGVY